MDFFKKIPVPIAGLMLGLAGLGNLIQGYGIQYRYLAGILSLSVGILLFVSIFANPEGFSKQLKKAVPASVFPAASMAIIILASYLASFLPQLALYIWYGGILLHLTAVIWFSIRFIGNFAIEKVYPSYFIVYVGIVVASVTAPAFDRLFLGQVIFWGGFIAYMIVLPVVIYRVFWAKKIERPLLPTLTIFTAPAGLCLAGYLSAFPEKNLTLLAWLVFLTLAMIIPVIAYLPKMIAVGFHPSFSAFTFPVVITAIGLKSTANFLATEFNNTLLSYPALFVEILAIALVIFVFLAYLNYLLSLTKQEKLQTKQVKEAL